MSRRPELKTQPQLWYGKASAIKYASNSRMLHIQRLMSDRAIEILALPKNKCSYILDLGCGSGISGEALTDAGHVWVGVDISHSMLSIAVERHSEGDLFQSDLGHGLFFREGVFDACISISTLQWITNCDSSPNSTPKKRLANLFNSLFKCLKTNARAVFQLYPLSAVQMELIAECAIKAGFVFSVLIDFPNSSKAKKIYIVLDSGSVRRRRKPKIPLALNTNQSTKNIWQTPKETRMDENGNEILIIPKNTLETIPIQSQGTPNENVIKEQAQRSHIIHGIKKKSFKKGKKSRNRFQNKDWVFLQKERRRARGKAHIPRDSKYTARKRRPKF